MGKYGFRIKWFTVASFEMEKDGHHIVTDPFITLSPNSPCTYEDVENCELITLSHVHWDHITDIPVLMDKFPQAPLLVGSLSALPLVEWGNLIPQHVYPMDANLEVDFDWVKVKALFGRHVDFNKKYAELESQLRRKEFVDKAMGDMQVLGTLEYRNFFFTFPDGLKVLVWGNEFTPVQKNIVKALQPDIAIIQSTRQLSDIPGYCEFVKASGCKVVIPHHMDLSKSYAEYIPQLEALAAELKKAAPEVEFILPQYNQWIEL